MHRLIMAEEHLKALADDSGVAEHRGDTSHDGRRDRVLHS